MIYLCFQWKRSKTAKIFLLPNIQCAYINLIDNMGGGLSKRSIQKEFAVCESPKPAIHYALDRSILRQLYPIRSGNFTSEMMNQSVSISVSSNKILCTNLPFSPSKPVVRSLYEGNFNTFRYLCMMCERVKQSS